MPENHTNYFRRFEDVSRCEPSNIVVSLFWTILYIAIAKEHVKVYEDWCSNAVR